MLVPSKTELLTNLPCYLDVDRWIVYLSRHHIEEIMLAFSGDELYRLPASVFSCEGLTYLELNKCMLSSVVSSSKFSNLKTLLLINVHDPNGMIGAVVSNCTCLEILILNNFVGTNLLKIHAPKLQEMNILDLSCELIVDHAPCLAKAIFSLKRYTVEQNLNHVGKLDIIKVLGSLANMENLQLLGYSLQWLYGDVSISNTLPASYDCLKKLHLALDFTVKEELMAALFLFGSTPTLQVLEIVAAGSAVTNSWELKDMNITFNELRRVSMANITGAPHELQLIKGFLAKAPVLRSMTISLAAENTIIDESKIFIELMWYQRASQLAEIICKERIEFIYSI